MVKIEEIMKKNVVTADINTNMDSISKMMTNNKIGSVIFTEDKKPIDIVTTDDIVTMVSSGFDPKKTTIKDIHKGKKRQLKTISPEENILSVAKKMIKIGVKRFPVVDKTGNLLGIVSEKEILLVSPELIEILSEKLKEKIDSVPGMTSNVAGVCEACGQYADDLGNENGRWICGKCITY